MRKILTIMEFGKGDLNVQLAKAAAKRVDTFIKNNKIHWIDEVLLRDEAGWVVVEGDWTLPDGNVKDIFEDVINGQEVNLLHRIDFTDKVAMTKNPCLEIEIPGLNKSPKMEKEDFEAILANCKYPEYTFKVIEEGEEYLAPARLMLQAEYVEPAIITGEPTLQKTRKWVLSSWMTKSEITQTAFKCVLTSMEHRVREHFTYKEERVYSPHYDVEFLVELCKAGRFDEREDWYAEGKAEDKGK